MSESPSNESHELPELQVHAALKTPRGHDPYAALRFRDYRFYAAGNLASIIGQQMLSVALGLHIWRLTNSQTALGFVGLVQALPILCLSLSAGHVADIWNRKTIVLVTQLIVAISSFALAAVTLYQMTIPNWQPIDLCNQFLAKSASFFHERQTSFHSPIVPLLYVLLCFTGVARAFNDPARYSMLPQMVPIGVFSNMVTWNSSNFQIGSVLGPALGGAVIGILGEGSSSYALVYFLDGVCALLLFLFILAIRYRHIPNPNPERIGRAVSAGLRFVFTRKIILATLTLDLFAVLFGGATALLPVFADKTLHVGAQGLGWLRSAPAIGAFIMALLIAHLPPMKRAGKTLLWSVIGFGMATIVFGLSHSFWLSMFMLVLTGAFDNVSVVVRHTLVQVLTPNSMRGRVSAVNNVFIGASNEMGALESGLTASMFGHVASTVAGGIGSILVVLWVALWWPEVRKFGPLSQASPDP